MTGQIYYCLCGFRKDAELDIQTQHSLNSSSDSRGKGEQVRYLHVFLICGSHNFNLAQTESKVQPTKLQNYSLGRDSI